MIDPRKPTPLGASILTAFARAVAKQWVCEDQDGFVHIDVLAKATGLSNRTAVGAVGHLVKTGYLQPVEGKLILSDNPNTSRWIGWFAPTSQLGQWLVSNSIVPSDIVSGLFPHTAGWQDEHIDAFATEDSMDPYKVFQWGKTALQPDDRDAAAEAAHKRTLALLWGN